MVCGNDLDLPAFTWVLTATRPRSPESLGAVHSFVHTAPILGRWRNSLSIPVHAQEYLSFEYIFIKLMVFASRIVLSSKSQLVPANLAVR